MEIVRETWIAHLVNATRNGHVQGVFADHASAQLAKDCRAPGACAGPELCNGAGGKRKCFSFTSEFAARFNAAHAWLVNQTQDILAQLGGLYWIQTYRIDVCDYFALRQAVQEGQWRRPICDQGKLGWWLQP